MKLTIIPTDKSVYENQISYTNLQWDGTPLNVHALQFDTSENFGWIEYNDGTPNETIKKLPSWAENAMFAWKKAYDEAHKPPQPPTADENKTIAVQLLAQTDYAELPSVSNPAESNPYLNNKDEFIAYRSKIRDIAVNPVAGDIAWPIMPQGDWVKV